MGNCISEAKFCKNFVIGFLEMDNISDVEMIETVFNLYEFTMYNISNYMNIKRPRFISFSSPNYAYTVRYLPQIFSFYNIKTLKSLEIPIDDTSEIGKKTKIIIKIIRNLLIEERKKIESLNFDEKVSNIKIIEDNKKIEELKELIRLEKFKLNYTKPQLNSSKDKSNYNIRTNRTISILCGKNISNENEYKYVPQIEIKNICDNIENLYKEISHLNFIKNEFENLIIQRRKLDLILLNISLFLGATSHLIDDTKKENEMLFLNTIVDDRK